MQEPADIADTPPDPRSRLKIVRPGSGTPDFKRFLREHWRVLAVLTTLSLGILLVLLGWYGAAHTNIFTEQIPYLISGGLLGLGLIIISGFMAYAFVVERQNEELRRDIAKALSNIRVAPARADSAEPAGPAGDRYYAVRGGKSYHLAGCPIVEGKEDVRELTGDAARALAPCKLCSPG